MTVQPNDYTRRLLSPEPSKIESICNARGYKIVASVIEGLEARERDHRKHCPASKGAKA